MWRRLMPVFSLFLLSPLIAEYLLGSLPTTMIAILPIMALMYGSGAILIRELTRQAGRGWPTLILLAAAYGVIEEGLVTQSLFNPNYMHLRLLDYGWIPAVGTALPWLVYVIGLHVFWSISVPIGLTEALFVNQRATPWLGKVGLAIFTLLFLAGAGLIATFTYKQLPFMASPVQLGSAAAVALALAVTGFLMPKPSEIGEGRAPHPVILFLASFVPGSLFMGMEQLGARMMHLPWIVPASILAGLELLVLAFMVVFTRARRWSDLQRFALMTGGLCVYVWCGFPIEMSLHGPAGLPGHLIIVGLIALLIVIAGVRAVKASR